MNQGSQPSCGNLDGSADDEIRGCLNLETPRSFFLFAGAGSGKTRSLVSALKHLRENAGSRLRQQGRRVGVVTYTNAACDEIKQRLDFDPFVDVATIHSFVWSLIGGFHRDIKSWLQTDIAREIARLKEEQARGRPGTKAAAERELSIKSKQQRLANLATVKRFSYSPTGDNRGVDSLHHAEVLKIGADFLNSKPLMQNIFVSKFPIFLVDESQDTSKVLMEALLVVQAKHKQRFALGLFGDTMQRIYPDGKADLGRGLPADWSTPAKKINHRSGKRIVRLINQIRSAVDSQTQQPRTDANDGFVRLFILPAQTPDKPAAEQEVCEQMATITSDAMWNSKAAVKTLILEHHMAAQRLGFLDMFRALYEEETLKVGLLDGSLGGLHFFSQQILPLVRAKQAGDDFTAAAILRKSSPLMTKAAFQAAGKNQVAHIKRINVALEELVALWQNGLRPTFRDVLRTIARNGLFEIPESLQALASHEAAAGTAPSATVPAGDHADSRLAAWDAFLEAPFDQIEPYFAYVTHHAPFDTHQGVKGLEFPRVMVIIDDAETRGFLFSYEKLFGAKAKSKTDLDHESAGSDSSIDRTRRLFYVTCSRAENSLAVVAYSSNPITVRDHVVREGWFESAEVIMP